MAKMNYKQIEHAQGRLRSIQIQLQGKKPQQPSTPDEDEIVRELASGRRITPAILQAAAIAHIERSNCRRYSGVSFRDCLSAEIHKKSREKKQAGYEAQMSQYKARCAKIEVKFTQVNDEIVLGDCGKALKLLNDFSDLTI